MKHSHRIVTTAIIRVQEPVHIVWTLKLQNSRRLFMFPCNYHQQTRTVINCNQSISQTTHASRSDLQSRFFSESML